MAKPNRGGSRARKTDGELEKEVYLKDHARVEAFLSSKTEDQIQLANGQYFEKSLSASKLSEHIKDTVDENGIPLDSDTTIYIKYKDGTEAFSGWDGDKVVDAAGRKLKRLKRTGIETYIEDGSWGSHVYGKVKIVDYNQRYEKWGGADWRAE